MSRRARASDMRHKVGVYKQVNVRNANTGSVEQKWLFTHHLWCRDVTIFREQLEMDVSGGTTLRNRKEFETRYPANLSTRNRIEHNGELYRVSIVGDTTGSHDRVRFLAERLEDGGA